MKGAYRIMHGGRLIAEVCGRASAGAVKKIARALANPTLVHHGMIGAASYHVLEEPGGSRAPLAFADLYDVHPNKVRSLVQAMADATGRRLIVLDNRDVPPGTPMGKHPGMGVVPRARRNPAGDPVPGEVWTTLAGGRCKVLAVNAVRVQVLHQESGEREWINRGDFFASYRPPRGRKNPAHTPRDASAESKKAAARWRPQDRVRLIGTDQRGTVLHLHDNQVTGQRVAIVKWDGHYPAEEADPRSLVRPDDPDPNPSRSSAARARREITRMPTLKPRRLYRARAAGRTARTRYLFQDALNRLARRDPSLPMGRPNPKGRKQSRRNPRIVAFYERQTMDPMTGAEGVLRQEWRIRKLPVAELENLHRTGLLARGPIGLDHRYIRHGVEEAWRLFDTFATRKAALENIDSHATAVAADLKRIKDRRADAYSRRMAAETASRLEQEHARTAGAKARASEDAFVRLLNSDNERHAQLAQAWNDVMLKLRANKTFSARARGDAAFRAAYDAVIDAHTVPGKAKAIAAFMKHGLAHFRRLSTPNPSGRKRSRRARKNPSSELARAKRTSAMWNEFPATSARRVRVRSRVIPRHLVKLGELDAVVYRSKKYSGKPTLYEHRFKRPLPVLTSDPDGRAMHIVGGGFKITGDGLVN